MYVHSALVFHGVVIEGERTKDVVFLLLPFGITVEQKSHEWRLGG